MIFYLIGVDYKTASLEAREELCREHKAIAAFWPHNSAVLLTCNRIEIYAWNQTMAQAQRAIRELFSQFRQFRGNCTIVYGYENVFRHLLRLAAGLESGLQGESQVLWQIEAWQKQTERVPFLKEIVGSAIARARKIRNDCGLNEASPDIATVVYRDIEMKMGNNSGYNMLILGTGKVAERFAQLSPANARMYFAAHKNFSKAERLAQQAAGQAIKLSGLTNLGFTVDVLIGATASPHHVLGYDVLAALLEKRKEPLYVYDLALPRDIDPQCRSLAKVVLYDLHTMQHLFEEQNNRIRERIDLAEYLCAQESYAPEIAYA